MLRSIIFVAMPPTVSIERESGVTSIRIRSAAAPVVTRPPSLAPCTAAPSATHSSGLRLRDGSFPVRRRTFSCTAGIRVEPPTSSTIPSCAVETPASSSTLRTGISVRSTRLRVRSSNTARETSMSRCFGSPWIVVIKGRLIFTIVWEESVFFASSAASRTR